MEYYKAHIVLESYPWQQALSNTCAQVPSPVCSHCGPSLSQPIAKGTNPIYKEGIQDTIHMRETRFGPRSIARVLAVASGPRAWSAVAHRKLPPPPASEREQTKQINRKQAAVVAPIKHGGDLDLPSPPWRRRHLCDFDLFARASPPMYQGRDRGAQSEAERCGLCHDGDERHVCKSVFYFVAS